MAVFNLSLIHLIHLPYFCLIYNKESIGNIYLYSKSFIKIHFSF